MSQASVTRQRTVPDGLSQRGLGVALLLLSAGVFSTAGLFTKGVEAGSWAIIFWRGLFAGLFTLVYLLARGRFRMEFATLGASGWAVAIIGAAGSAIYIPALKITSIANVTLIYAAVPLLAAAMAWAWIGERPSRRVLLCCLAAFLGVLVIVQGSLGAPELVGDLMALGMTASLAAIMVIYRRFPDTPVGAPAFLMCVLLLPPAIVFGEPLAASLGEIGIMSAFGLIFSVAYLALAEGARRVPAAEAGLLSSLEMPLAPLWAWLLLAELPPVDTWIGGAAIMGAVLYSQMERKTPCPAQKD